MGACGAHSIETKNQWNQPQGQYAQKCMQEYCKRGLKNGGGGGGGGGGKGGKGKQAKNDKEQKEKGRRRRSWGWSLLAKRRNVQRHNASWWSYGKYVRPPKGNNDQYKPGGETPQYYCAELCHNMYHPVMGNGMGQHPGTQGCSDNYCPSQDQCNRDCNANWENGMKPIYDDFCACPDAHYAANLLEAAAEENTVESESVDVGAFIQTSVSDKKADEL